MLDRLLSLMFRSQIGPKAIEPLANSYGMRQVARFLVRSGFFVKDAVSKQGILKNTNKRLEGVLQNLKDVNNRLK